MRAVTAVIASRVKFIRIEIVQAVGAQHLTRAKQLIIAGERCIIWIPGSIAKFARQARIFRQRSVATVIGKAGMLRPDSGVNNTHHYILTGVTSLPGTGRVSQAQETRGVIGHRLAQLILENHHDVRLRLDRFEFSLGQNSGVAIQSKRIIVNFCASRSTGCCKRGVMFLLQEFLIFTHFGAIRIDLFALFRFGGRITGDITIVGNDRITLHNDNI